MSKMRHHKAEGGALDKDDAPSEVYAGKGSHVEEEAEEKKHGGHVGHKRKAYKDGGHVMGHAGKKRLDRPGRKRGGGIGSDMTPLTSAARVTSAEGHSSGVMTGSESTGKK